MFYIHKGKERKVQRGQKEGEGQREEGKREDRGGREGRQREAAGRRKKERRWLLSCILIHSHSQHTKLYNEATDVAMHYYVLPYADTHCCVAELCLLVAMCCYALLCIAMCCYVLLCTLTMIPILFLSEVKGNSCRISYERVWSFGSSICMVVRSRSTRVTPTLSVHFTSAIYVGVWCVWLCIISEGREG